jgi:hypothetical protein
LVYIGNSKVFGKHARRRHQRKKINFAINLCSQASITDKSKEIIKSIKNGTKKNDILITLSNLSKRITELIMLIPLPNNTQ